MSAGGSIEVPETARGTALCIFLAPKGGRAKPCCCRCGFARPFLFAAHRFRCGFARPFLFAAHRFRMLIAQVVHIAAHGRCRRILARTGCPRTSWRNAWWSRSAAQARLQGQLEQSGLVGPPWRTRNRFAPSAGAGERFKPVLCIKFWKRGVEVVGRRWSTGDLLCLKLNYSACL